MEKKDSRDVEVGTWKNCEWNADGENERACNLIIISALLSILSCSSRLFSVASTTTAVRKGKWGLRNLII